MGLSPEEISQITYDLPPIRYGYMRSIANFEYGETRSCCVGNGKVIVLLPVKNKSGIPLTDKEKIDYLAHAADKYRKNSGEIPDSLLVFLYEINWEEKFAILIKKEAIKADTLFTEEAGYYETQIKNIG